MANLKVAVLKARKTSKGNYPIFISVTQKRDVRYIKTEYSIDDLYQFENGKIVCRKDAKILNQRIQYNLSELQDKLDSIPDIRIFNASQIKDILEGSKEDKLITIKEWFETRIEDFRKQGRGSYANMNLYTLSKILDSLGNITLQSLNVYSVHKFKESISNLAGATQQMRLTHFKARVNEAIKERLVNYDTHPFSEIKMPKSAPKLLDITIDEFRKILDYKTNYKTKQLAKDLFLLSFYLGGINLADLVRVDLSGPILIYERKKTQLSKEGDKIIKLTIPDVAMPIINKYKTKTGKLNFGYKFSYSNFQRYLNGKLKILANEVGIKSQFSYYSARKTFAQFAFDLGVKTEVIEYCIGQSMKSNRPIYNYVRVMQRQADGAISKVIDYTINPEKYADVIYSEINKE